MERQNTFDTNNTKYYKAKRILWLTLFTDIFALLLLFILYVLYFNDIKISEKFSSVFNTLLSISILWYLYILIIGVIKFFKGRYNILIKVQAKTYLLISSIGLIVLLLLILVAWLWVESKYV